MMSDTRRSQTTGLDLFVSHSSEDAQLVRAVVTLLERGLKLHAARIRATSIPGYKLGVGDPTEQRLLSELQECTQFLVILTPSSLLSPYVLLEFGARWCTGRSLAPVVARGTTPNDLRDPIKTLNALKLYDKADVLQLVGDVAKTLGIHAEPEISYDDAVDSVVREAMMAAAPKAPLANTADESQPVDEEEEVVLVELNKAPQQTSKAIATRLSLPHERVLFHLEELERRKLVYARYNQLTATTYQLDQLGRKHLIGRKLI